MAGCFPGKAFLKKLTANAAPCYSYKKKWSKEGNLMEERYVRAAEIEWDKLPQDTWLRGIPALRCLGKLQFSSNITLFAGENGTGKSTLLEGIAVACGFNPEGGTFNYRFSTFEEDAGLGTALRVSKGFRRPPFGYFFRAESFFNVASQAEIYRKKDLGVQPKEVYYSRYGGRALHEQSHGESFLSWFQSCNEQGLYLMDEPEAALSPQRQLALLIQMVRMARKGAQFIVASHSPILLGAPEAVILAFDEQGARPCTYEETGSYQLTRLFLEDKDRLIKQLLQEEEEDL